MKAYKKGDYINAFNELKLLAKTGHSKAQHFLGDMYYKEKILTKITNLLLNGIPFQLNKVMKFPNTILELCIVLD